MSAQPLFSFVLPVFKPDLVHLRKCLGSLLAQDFPDSEICIGIDGPHPQSLVRRLKSCSPARVRLRALDKHGGISSCTNAAAGLATGKWLVFIDQDDTVERNTLSTLAEFERNADVLYTDEDKIVGPWHFARFVKPDYSVHHLMACNYLAHCRACRRELFHDVGGCNTAYDGAQDYDLALRMTGANARVLRVPRLLYHWRASVKSTSMAPESKTFAFEAAVRALSSAFPDRSFETVPNQPGYYRWRMKTAGQKFSYPVVCADGAWVVSGAGTEASFERIASPAAGASGSWTLHAPLMRMETLASSRGFLATVPCFFDPAATTVSFRARRSARLISGGINEWDGKLWIAASKPYMGLDRVCAPCVFPNALLFATKKTIPPHILPKESGAGLDAFFRWWAAAQDAVHLDAPLWIEPRNGTERSCGLPDLPRFSDLPPPRLHRDYLRFLASYRPGPWQYCRPRDPGMISA